MANAAFVSFSPSDVDKRFSDNTDRPKTLTLLNGTIEHIEMYHEIF